MIFCGESSTPEVAGSVKENVETTQTSVSSGTEQSQEVNKTQQPQNNNNPFSDPNYAECLINAFGEDRYKQLQNERPTQEEEQKVGECLGAPSGPQGPSGQEDRPSEEYCKENQSDPKCQGGSGGPQGPSGQEDRPSEEYCKENQSDPKCQGGSGGPQGPGNSEESTNSGGPTYDEDHQNFYTYFGDQNQRHCIAYKLYGDISQDNITKVDEIFQGRFEPSDIGVTEEEFFTAAKQCGYFGTTCPYVDPGIFDYQDLGYPINYQTEGITAIPLDDPSFLTRPPGYSTLADPTAAVLDNGKIALYFGGDHREPFQSTRWVSDNSIISRPSSLSFTMESDYNLTSILGWRQVIKESSNDWVMYGNPSQQEGGWSRYTSSDGLNWGNKTTLITAATINQKRTELGFSETKSINAFVTKMDNKYFASFEGLREFHPGDDETNVVTDKNGDGFEHSPYFLIYNSSDGINWTFDQVVYGHSEGKITKISSNIYVLFGTWEENKGCAYFSNDGKNWGWGIETPFIQLDINLGDGSWLGFGTWSKSDGGISAETTVIDISKVTSKYLQPANLESMPEYDEIEGVFP